MSSTAESPISFRPDPAQRELITQLAESEGLSASAVIKRGLSLLSAVQAGGQVPLYARSVDDEDVELAVEAAASAACKVLDALFRQYGAPEVRGIGSNFQGLLADHLRAMLTGLEHAQKTHSTPLPALLARWDSFGRHVNPKGERQGVTLMRPSLTVGEVDLFLSERQWVPLERIDVGGLFTSSEAAVKGYLEDLRRKDVSPREYPARLVVIDFSGEKLVAYTR